MWRKAAEDVYAVIGAKSALHASPPITASHWRPDGIGPASYGYFNLHGLDNAPYWYGQRDPGESIYPDFPVALRPEDVVNSGRAPRVVFSAACYGASVAGKSARESLALRFLECGTLGFVGATAIAYGGVSRPLVGADLLARHFWERLSAGYAQGYALREAKRRFVQEMQYRQGYLDTEDYKTLISFVLYGDPTVYPEPARRKPMPKGGAAGAATAPPDVTLAGRPEPAPPDTLSNEVVQQVKGLIAPFLPGVHEAEVTLSVPKLAKQCPTDKQSKARPAPSAILTLRKEHHLDGVPSWQQIARVAVTDSGQVVKMTVSK
ncbi:MAG: C25 family cysteine peptidase [Anaerolineae bacterium]|nr:C25 family cysteine peptidase [Anaerolineae bacterium]